MTNPQIFVDMDGVLADFDSHYEAVFGVRPDKAIDNVDWQRVRDHKGFYGDIPPMADMRELWRFLRLIRPQPIVLTGIPYSVEEAEANKRGWVREYLGDVQVIGCKSKDKCLYIKNPGDVLIDDWEKHKQAWIDVGGRWITHVSAKETVRQLIEIGILI